ncbi:hypothetical protein V5O48_016801 [Marasmius crinis-equi]|uniref:Uncharacterized protein n=1 Tax=Marasmius crinis-equi TaxID=585013 RepID=A0ABR3EQQ5_9AGAR
MPADTMFKLIQRVYCSGWYRVCEAAGNPTEELLSALRNFDLEALYHTVLTKIHDQGWRFDPSDPSGDHAMWWGLLAETHMTIEWLEGLTVKHEDVISHFRTASAGFHISMPDASDLNAALEVVGTNFLSTILLEGESYDIFGELDRIPYTAIEGPGVKIIRVTGCLEHLTASHTLTPTECSPGVFFIQPHHIYPFLLAVASRNDQASQTVDLLLEEHYYWGPMGRRAAGPSLIRVLGPSPALLPLFERELPEMIDKLMSRMSVMLKHLVLWLEVCVLASRLATTDVWNFKSFPEEYAPTTAPLVQLIKKRALDPRFPGRELVHNHEKLSEVLDIKGVGSRAR